MAHYGTLRDYHFTSESADDVRGSAIYGATDEKLGKIHDVIFDHTTGEIRYVVVDTGGWLRSKHFIVPADRLERSPKHEDDYHVGLTKEQIESFPAYDEKTVESQQRWGDYERRYQSAWGAERNVSRTSVSPNLGSRWTAFQRRLHRDRESFVSHCGVCGTERQRKVS